MYGALEAMLRSVGVFIAPRSRALPLSETGVQPQRPFEALPIDARLKQRIARKGYVHLTDIQEQTFEPLLAGHDVKGIANTGTGKTAAFLIPIIHRLLTGKSAFQILILVPTRELALQVQEEFNSLTKGLRLYSTSLIGGTNINQDIQRLRKTNHLIIGTPGRILDLINRRALKLQYFSTLILDEFDRMLDMGFKDDVLRITGELTNRKQTLLFSATENKGQRLLINQLLHRPTEIKITAPTSTAEHVEQNIVRIAENDRTRSVWKSVAFCGNKTKGHRAGEETEKIGRASR